MSAALENATKFFHACERSEGWEGCREYVAPGASFECQAQPLAEVDTVEAYTEWMVALGEWMPDASYEVHASAWDEENRAATFFATYRGTHTGEGAPVPPTNRKTASHYVYVIVMNGDDRVEHLYKIWNAPWAMRELGWA